MGAGYKLKLRRDITDNWVNANPPPVLAEGEPAIDTNRNIMKIGNGNNLWNDLESLKGIPEDYINVKDFGAVGDGNTDDTEAIQKAINNIENGQTLYFPYTPNGYRITNSIIISKNINIQMDGKIVLDADNIPAIIIKDVEIKEKFLKFYVEKAVQSDWVTDDSKGILVTATNQLTAILRCQIYIIAKGFNKGFAWDADTEDYNMIFAWNTITGGKLENNLYGFYFVNHGPNGFINANLFMPIYIGVRSDINTTISTIYGYYFNGNGLSCNDNMLFKQPAEGSRLIFAKLIGCYHFQIVAARNEATQKLVSLENCYDIDISTTFSPLDNFDISYTADSTNNTIVNAAIDPETIKNIKYDLISELKYYSSNNAMYPFVYLPYDTENPKTPTITNQNFIYISSINPLKYTYISGLLHVGVLIKLNDSTLIKIKRSGIAYRMLIRFYAGNPDTGLTLIDETTVRNNVQAIKNFTLLDGYGFKEVVDLNGEEEIIFWINPEMGATYMFISPFLGTADGVTITKFEIVADVPSDGIGIELYYPKNNLPPYDVLFGTSTERPTTNYTGQQYWDTDLNKLIIWDGTQWIYPDGTPV